MQEKPNGNGNKTWVQWLAGILVLIALTVSGYAINKIDTVQTALAKEYVQKTDFQTFADRVEKKLDKIQDLLMRDDK